MKTRTRQQAADIMVGWIEPKPEGTSGCRPLRGGGYVSPGGMWRHSAARGWINLDWYGRALSPLDLLDDCIRCIESRGFIWEFYDRVVESVPHRTAAVYTWPHIDGRDWSIPHTDGQHALHLAEAALSADAGEDVRVGG